ncbi:MAG: UDP-N-acetylglucosamine--N-acetylmuramyl-(pentapeptide) pyrophosphoryl-undecaprenol N-acetylglucosamine transferase [Candidatus Berkelbacteria bacterium Gr01-1014_85]|uniref:UDP-N-acetylglucosamine--N-acetylmuramyl-(pentapeptide) pyrophosphoryl-undecaprenol N-acetylglucosamine transferase n=1 Tax=Candidatus Berkelbacteria bacterium Gr01-1014_85 TaxID=2017150 RepID=A0A554JAF8_9BACT|nr:MAG: UDP-N-acetylglucosamine--N-acetylmuramyl-(pentapeptide) pyrophosphoryl-undecaprenol N-acetylglucosamine transferase [Candidatus Berkelbacteria bacterium Gr01-1014_85]
MAKAQSTPKPIIFLVGGGSGGHLVPLLALVPALKSAGWRPIVITGYSALEKQLVAETKVATVSVLAGKWPRYFSWRLPLELAKFGLGLLQAFGLILKYQPRLILTKGGYLALPMAMMTWLFGKPLIAHESDAELGLTNRLIARLARLVLVGYPVSTYPNQWRAKLNFVGQPLRQQPLPQQPSRPVTGSRLPNLMVIGGSQGAVALNSLILEALPKLTEELAVTHLTGQFDYARVQTASEGLSLAPDRYRLLSTLTAEKYYQALTEATIVVSRAGANSLAELASWRKPSLVIPLPTAAQDHQRANARYFWQREAIIYLEQADLQAQPDRLAQEILSLLSKPERRQELSRNIYKLATPKTIDRIVELLQPWQKG